MANESSNNSQRFTSTATSNSDDQLGVIFVCRLIKVRTTTLQAKSTKTTRCFSSAAVCHAHKLRRKGFLLKTWVLYGFSFPYVKMAGVLKKSTLLTRVPVAVNPHHTLGVLYSKILRAIDKMPKDYPYRINTETIIKERAAHVKNNPVVADFEKAIDCGQAEELIIQAESELQLARKFLGWKPWEPLVQEAPANQWMWPPTK